MGCGAGDYEANASARNPRRCRAPSPANPSIFPCLPGCGRQEGALRARRRGLARPSFPTKDAPRDMTALANVTFRKPGRKPAGTLVVIAGEDVQLGPLTKKLANHKLVARAASAAAFKGKAMAVLDLYAPGGSDLNRLIVVGCGKTGE